MHGLCVSKNWYWARGVDGEIRRADGSSYAGSNNQQPAVLNEMHATLIDLNAFSHEITAMQRQRKPLRVYYSLANAVSRHTYMRDVFETYESVYFEGIPLGFATAGIINEGDPSDWDAILVRRTETATGQEFDAMQTYLDQGGSVIMDAESFRTNEYGQARRRLRQGRGCLHIVDSLGDMKKKALGLVGSRGGLPEVSVKEINGVGLRGCVWRCVRNGDGYHVLSIVNTGKSDARLEITRRNANARTVCRDLLTGVVVDSESVLKPFEVFFVEITDE
jgi:beta-galactosidase